jgi:CTP:molybdopterin cytidylyltransferase MocA
VTTYGVLLAAGAGSRMGMPKALKRDPDGTSWLRRAVEETRKGGCDEVYVVLGAAVDEALPLLDGAGVELVVAHNWSDGMSASLVSGLTALESTAADAALVMLVDLPDVNAAVISRMLTGAGSESLRRAAYDGVPGHPALLGRTHWRGVVEVATGDKGARPYFLAHDHEVIECGDLATGIDRDSDN